VVEQSRHQAGNLKVWGLNPSLPTFDPELPKKANQIIPSQKKCAFNEKRLARL